MTGATTSAGSVLVVDPHPIFRRGLVACLGALEEVTRVEEAASADDARPRLARGWDLVLIDHVVDGAEALISELAASERCRVVVCSDRQTDEAVRASLEAGAIGFLAKSTLRAETLVATLLAAAGGNGIFAPNLVSTLASSAPRPAPAVAAEEVEAEAQPSPLTPREHNVLALAADGEPTREIARRLCYSERTVKNVLHDVTIKLGARSRSHAIAHAVRQGFI